MTANQIAYMKAIEEQRTHRAQETENQRHNVVTEAETKRANTLNAEVSQRNVDVQTHTQRELTTKQVEAGILNTQVSSDASRYGASASAGATTYAAQLNYDINQQKVAEEKRHNEAQERISIGGKLLDFASGVAKWLVPTLAH